MVLRIVLRMLGKFGFLREGNGWVGRWRKLNCFPL